MVADFVRGWVRWWWRLWVSGSAGVDTFDRPRRAGMKELGNV